MKEFLFVLAACVMMGWFITLQIQIIRQRRLGFNLRGRMAKILRTKFISKRKG